MPKPFYMKTISFNRLEYTLKEIKKRVYIPVGDLLAEYAPSKEPVLFEDRLSLNYKPIKTGEKWGDLFDCAWFNIKGTVPPECKGKHIVALLDFNGEACLFSEEGVPLRGLTNMSSTFERAHGEPGKRVLQLFNPAKGGEEINLWFDAGCNDLFGGYNNGVVEQMEIAVCDDRLRKMYYDYWVLLDLAKTMNKETARYSQLIFALNEVSNLLIDFNEETLAAAEKILEKQLAMKSGDTGLNITAVGHAHLDLAWLWPIRETKRKAARTFATAIELMDRYPNYIFGVSQPQQFEWIKQEHPRLYEKIKQKVSEGRIEPQGALWCEPDLNVSGGEALVRQVMFGKRFFKNEFGKDMNIAHIPDVFGFTAALPQILIKSGVTKLCTIKMSWNRHNQFPYHTFNWKGLDGKSSVLVHMPPEGNYNSMASPRIVEQMERQYLDKGVCDEALLLFGIGDGGGGPGSDHLERLQRIENLSGISPVAIGTQQEFFDSIEKGRETYPVYDGEMYLECHQGTYTTQAKNKYYNRRMEQLMHDAELICSIAFKMKGQAYPHERINEIWKEVLLYQFHDILPGSSIARVYEESVARYQILEKEILSIIETVLAAFPENEKSCFNPSPFENKVWQNNEKANHALLIEPMGGVTQKGQEFGAECAVGKNYLENDNMLVKFGSNGEICSYFDKKNNREVLAAPSNILNIYDDSNGDAWDMEEGYLERKCGQFSLEKSEEFIENGFAVRRQTLKYGKSTMVQCFALKPGDTQLDVNNHVEWHEDKKTMKAGFYPDICSDYVNCNIQFGNIRRSIKNNTPYELAQNEICAHKYIDISEGDYGFSIFNDCKYGYSASKDGILMSLLRSPDYPGINADRGSHEFNFALYPHENSFENSDVVKRAYGFNSNVYTGYEVPNFIRLNSPSSVIIETVKKAEDSNGIVVRMYESVGNHTDISLETAFEFEKVWNATMDEAFVSEVFSDGQKVDLCFEPFEIVTLIFE